MSTTAATTASSRMESFHYDDDIVRKFTLATLVWGLVGMLVGLLVSLQLALPAANMDTSWLTFGRLRPLHTNAVIFAFGGNGIFAAIYYSSQRLLKARMFSDALSRMHFWGWQLIIVAAALTLPLGITQGKEYAELEWPIDLAVVVVWVLFAVNFFGTLIKRRERHLYVGLWFYIATIIAIAVLYIANNAALPVSMTKSYSVYSGVQDAFMQWWYGHNAVAFFLTTPFLGLMYYFLPKAANRPVYSYRLSILHFWSLVFIYIWAGPHHLMYTSMPEWLTTLGMLFSIMLWMPSWGGMLNGLLTLRGAWNKVAEDPILKFYVVAVTFYGMSTFEGPMLSIKSINALSHYTDWTIAHVHSGTLGWNGFMIFGMMYWLMPRLFQTGKLWSAKLCTTHFWIGTIGILLYVVPIWAAGITQGLMWRSITEQGTLQYGDFLQTVTRLEPLYWLRLVGGTLYFVGVLLCGVQMFMTWKMRPATYDVPVIQAPALEKAYSGPEVTIAGNPGPIGRFASMAWHRSWERKPMFFTVMVAIAVIVASLAEIVPTFMVKSVVTPIASVTPYTPLEQAGFDIYRAEGCYNCHSQQVRPMRHETLRYGEYSKTGESIYDRPFQWGSRRIGPDLARVGDKLQSVNWHIRHFNRPSDISEGTIMPAYPWLLEDDIDFDGIQATIDRLSTLGHPYSDEVKNDAPGAARAQAKALFARLVKEDASYADSGLEGKKVMALTAYMLRLGTDISKDLETPSAAELQEKEASDASGF
ncbi:MAG: cytochrome-c oxidase, cbb3-type subunit I [bacterium]|nr:cytochrome-c oxidase, cbb3-type subunit I [bacterium]